MELLRANVLSTAYLSQAEDKFYRGRIVAVARYRADDR